MSCVLRAVGVEFEPEEFLADSSFAAASVFKRGEARVPDEGGGATRGASGFNLVVSEGGLDELSQQIEDALSFLREHEDELRRLGSYPDVEGVCLDFAIARKDVAAQSEIFPADLLWQAGALDIDLVVTHHAADPDGPAPRHPRPS